MKLPDFCSALALVSVLAACNSTGGGGSTGGSSTLATSFTGMGTFTAMVSDAGPINATLAPVMVLSGMASSPGTFALGVADQGAAIPSGGTVTFTSPGGIANEDVVVNIIFPSAPPAPGTFTQTSPGFCGGVSVAFATASLSVNEAFSADLNTCSDAGDPNVGTWSLTLSGLSEGPTLGSTVYYTAHGSLTASLVDANSNPGTLSLTF